MNFSLQKLESHLSDRALVEGETIYSAGGVKQLFELEKHLWLAEVETADKYEVEVKISPSKVLAATCECPDFIKYKECGHFAAVLFKLRSYLTTLKVKKKRANESKKSKRKLTTNVILEQVPSEELHGFIREYAKTNRNFALALKAKFAAHVSQITSTDKYLQLLESMINMVRRPDRSISSRGVQKINKVLEELIGQIGDNIARENYMEALCQVQSIIEKITPILKKATDEKGLLIGAILEAFNLLNNLVQEPIPPALSSNIWNYCSTESKKLTYRSNQLDLKFFELMMLQAKDKLRLEHLLNLLDEQIERYKREDRVLSKLILVKVQVFDKAGRQKAIQKLIEDNLSNPSILFYAIDQYIKRKNYKRANQLALDGLKLATSKTIIGQLEEILLRLAEKEGKVELVLSFAEKRFLGTLNPEYYFKIRAYYPGNWLEKVKSLVDSLEKMPYSLKKRDTIALIFKEENQHKELLTYLQKVASIDLLKEYGPYLIKVYRKETYQLYITLLNSYLRNHLGRKPSVKIKAVIYKLMEEGEPELAESLVEQFREGYPERHSLMEELEVF